MKLRRYNHNYSRRRMNEAWSYVRQLKTESDKLIDDFEMNMNELKRIISKYDSNYTRYLYDRATDYINAYEIDGDEPYAGQNLSALQSRLTQINESIKRAIRDMDDIERNLNF